MILIKETESRYCTLCGSPKTEKTTIYSIKDIEDEESAIAICRMHMRQIVDEFGKILERDNRLKADKETEWR